jgi:O-antigen/teichoic acid export membrane protein
MILKKYFSGLDGNERSKRAIKNIVSSFAIKGLSIAINLALIPLTINYLHPTKYGVWLTISSMLGWISFFDIGLGHGLRNKLAEAIARNETEKAKTYVSTAYISISIVCLALFLLFLIFNQFINWNYLLNVPKEIDENLKNISLILFSMFSVQFILQLINSILLSNQQPAKVSFFNMLSNLLVLIGISLLVKFTKQSLLHIAFVFSSIPVLVLIVVNIYLFKTKFKNFAPSIHHFDFKALGDVLTLGVKFFIIQISVLIFFQTSNLLICRYFTPALVTPYNIAFRYFGIITMVFSIITAPYWTAYTDAYVKQDFVWMKKTIRNLIFMWMGLVAVALIMLIFSDFVYSYY